MSRNLSPKDTQKDSTIRALTLVQLDAIAAQLRARRGWGATIGNWSTLPIAEKDWWREETLAHLGAAGIGLRPRVLAQIERRQAERGVLPNPIDPIGVKS